MSASVCVLHAVSHHEFQFAMQDLEDTVNAGLAEGT